MAKKLRKLQKSVYQTVIQDKKILGYRYDPSLSNLEDGEFSQLTNMDIYAGKNGDFMKSRRGSQVLKKASGASAYGATAITNRITWDIGSEEYLITQTGTSMYSQALITTGNPTLIALATGGAFTLGSTTAADLFISGDKLYILHPSANYVIRWTGSVFVAYSMGLAYPWIATVTSANAGVITGSYTIGIEKVYRASGVDLMASTPNRRIPTSRILAQTGTITSKKIKITIQATELDNDSLWTHLRVWRSKNKNVDITDPINPIDAQGLDDELYEEALITAAEIGAGALASIATGSTLPLGNVGTQAGKPAGVYTIEVNNLDTVFFNLIGIDRIELLPIPACTTGCFNANRIFFSGVQDATLDDASKNNIWYSNYAGTKYAFQYDPLNFVDTGRDGQNMIKLVAFEKDVIGLKEKSTGRLPSGNVDIPYQQLDEKIGISHINYAQVIPTIGIAAITSDGGDFQIFGYDLRWSRFANGINISTPIRNLAGNLSNYETHIIYINGKIIISSAGTTYVLHIREQRGWSTYDVLTYGRVFTFATSSRMGSVVASGHLCEFEVSGINSDYVAIGDTTTNPFPCYFQTRPYMIDNGNVIIEHEYLSINGKFITGNVSVFPYLNGLAWAAFPSLTATYLAPNASIAGSNATLADREYRGYIQPATIGSLKWAPMAGNNLYYQVITSAPLLIRSIALHCIADEDGIGYGAFDPTQSFPTTNTDPTWAQ